jgi:putative membrane protein
MHSVTKHSFFLSRPRAFALAILAATTMGGCDVEFRGLEGESIGARLLSTIAPANATAPSMQRAFLTQAAQASLFEIQASKVALARGGSAAVRRYAEATLRDRIAVDTDLEQLAASIGVVLPSRLSDEFQARLTILEHLTGSDFDRAYAKNVGVLAQQQALATFERAADPAGARVQRFAAGRIPMLREHLEQGRRLASEVDRTNMA